MFTRLIAALLLLCALALPGSSTINTSNSKTIALGTGAQTTFAFTFVGVAAQYISVTFTDASGAQTLLTQGSGANQYQITLNSPGTGQIWGIGGTITYNPSGIPIATGTSLTIARTLPLTQAVSLQNLGSIATLSKGSETAVDTAVMQGQQINEQISRAVQMNIANSRAPVPLPAAAALANQGICGSSDGLDLIACSLAPAGIISSAMAPVVGAATLAAGRTAFGLGTMATENINAGTCGGATIQDDGSGNARVVTATAADSTNQSVTCAFHLTQRMATGPITYTLAKASTNYFNGFTFVINASTGTETVTPNASDNFVGVASGTGIAIPQGSICWITTDAAGSATWWINCNSSQATLSASASANALTIVINGGAIPFRDTTLANGGGKWAIPAGGLAITVPLNATLGTSNNTPFRIWIFLAYNSGTPVLGVATCSSSTALFPCAAWETIRKSGTAISAGATSLGTLYTTSTVTNDSIRIIGYADYGSGLATAGTWASTPTTLQSCLPPFTCKRPGDLIQVVRTSTGAVNNGSNTFTSNDTIPINTAGDQYMTQNITPVAAPNVLEIEASGAFNAGAATRMFAGLFQDATANALTAVQAASTATATVQDVPIRLLWFMQAGTTSSTTFKVRAGNTTGANFTFNGEASTRVFGGVMNSYIQVKEIMG